MIIHIYVYDSFRKIIPQADTKGEDFNIIPVHKNIVMGTDSVQ